MRVEEIHKAVQDAFEYGQKQQWWRAVCCVHGPSQFCNVLAVFAQLTAHMRSTRCMHTRTCTHSLPPKHTRSTWLKLHKLLEKNLSLYASVRPHCANISFFSSPTHLILKQRNTGEKEGPQGENDLHSELSTPFTHDV